MPVLTVGLMMMFLFLGCASSYKDQRSTSPHFRDGQFHNPVASAKSFWSFISMRMRTTYATWPDWVDASYGKVNPVRVFDKEVHLTHINHSTVLIQTQGLNILTDPIYSERCSPISWAGPKRVRQPGIPFEELPPIDVVLISHDHYDHLDLPTIEMLIKRDAPKFYVGLGVGQYFDKSVQVTEMDWWQKENYNSDLEIHFVPVQHFSGRGLFDRNTTQWGGFVFKTPHGQVYFGGDTGYADHFQQTQERLGKMNISIIPIGAYEPRDFMAYAHINPKEAVQAHIDLKSKLSLGVHYGTFQLTAENFDDPVIHLKEELKAKNIPESEFITPTFGQVIKTQF